MDGPVSSPLGITLSARLTSLKGQLPLSALLVRLKVTRSHVKRDHLRSPILYDEFCEAACNLYDYLDMVSIEELEYGIAPVSGATGT